MAAPPPTPNNSAQAFDAELREQFPAELLIDSPDLRGLFGQDIFTAGPPVGWVFRPRMAADIARLVRLAARHRVAVIGRGGGMSYTGGYLPSCPDHAVVLDMSGIAGIVEINARDMYVIVETGCTWGTLNDALRAKGLRAAYWGPISGLKATVGGAISQNAIFYGSGTAGTAADTVLGIELVTGGGDILTTGSFGVSHCNAFFRQFGPDLTGLFTADTGALGIKTRVSLRLVPAPAITLPLSFAVPNAGALCTIMSQIAREGLAAQQMGLDLRLKDARLGGESLWAAAGHLARVVTAARNPLKGLLDAARIAFAGRRIAQDSPFSLHLFVEAGDQRLADALAARVKRIAADSQATTVEASIPRVMAATPFAPVNGLLGPKGERWVPMHCIVPHSRALDAYTAIARTLDTNRALLDQHGISNGYLFSTCGTNGFVIEPMFLWPDILGALHEATVDGKRLARFSRHPDNPDARAIVARLRKALTDTVDSLGAVHIQVGRYYPYRGRLNPAWNALLSAIRTHLDPHGIINPGALDQ